MRGQDAPLTRWMSPDTPSRSLDFPEFGLHNVTMNNEMLFDDLRRTNRSVDGVYYATPIAMIAPDTELFWNQVVDLKGMYLERLLEETYMHIIPGANIFNEMALPYFFETRLDPSGFESAARVMRRHVSMIEHSLNNCALGALSREKWACAIRHVLLTTTMRAFQSSKGQLDYTHSAGNIEKLAHWGLEKIQERHAIFMSKEIVKRANITLKPVHTLEFDDLGYPSNQTAKPATHCVLVFRAKDLISTS